MVIVIMNISFVFIMLPSRSRTLLFHYTPLSRSRAPPSRTRRAPGRRAEPSPPPGVCPARCCGCGGSSGDLLCLGGRGGVLVGLERLRECERLLLDVGAGVQRLAQAGVAVAGEIGRAHV